MDADRVRRMTKSMKRMIRATSALGDAARLSRHKIVMHFGREWEQPDAVLSDEEIEAIEARQLGRTLEEIDELPVASNRESAAE